MLGKKLAELHGGFYRLSEAVHIAHRATMTDGFSAGSILLRAKTGPTDLTAAEMAAFDEHGDRPIPVGDSSRGSVEASSTVPLRRRLPCMLFVSV